MYWVNPATYWIGGVLAAVLKNTQVVCLEGETGVFDPPPGQTCGEYAGRFVQEGRGYIVNPDARQNCGYCPYRNGPEYLATLNIDPGQKWRDCGIFLVFVCTNWMLVYFFIWSVRVKGFSFGMGWLFGTLRKAVRLVTGGWSQLGAKTGQEHGGKRVESAGGKMRAEEAKGELTV